VGADHPPTAKLWNLLGSIQHGQARYGDAETLFLRALAIQERAGDSKSAKTASILANLASVYASQGRENEALALHQRALAILSKERGENHKDTAVSLNNIATLHLQQGRLNEAASFGEKALSAHKSALGLEHPDTASVMSNLAQIYGSLGRHKEAESLLRQALEIRRKTLGESHLDSANSLHALGLLSLNQARYEEADSLLSRALPIAEATAGPRHPFTATTLMNLTAIQLLLNKPQAAIPLLTRLNRSQADWLRRELPLQPRDQRMVQLQRQPDAVATTFLLLDQDPSSAPLALETRLNRQGLLAEIEQRQRLLLSSSPQTHQLGERLAGLDRQLASVILTPTQRDALRSQRQQLEGELNRLLPALRIEPVSTAQVAAALKSLAPQGLLIEFQKYEPFSRTGSGPGTWGPSRYVALLLHPDGRIASIPLGPAAPIDQAIERALAASSANQVDADDLWAQVSALVFNPLAPELRNVTSLFLSPDGALHRIPYAALNAPGNGSQLLYQAFQLRLLTTGRDLLRLQQPAAAGSPPVLIANPDYNAIRRRSAATTAVGGNAGPQPGRATQPAASATTGRQQRSADLASNRVWAALPGTADEARALAPLLGIPQPITGASATSSLVLRQNAPRLLHIATHGFFQPDQPSTPSGPLDNKYSGNASAAARLEDPLLRSGLVLAGANHPDADPTDDGYLTAAEVTGINLNGTELVTLSACESGLGDLQSGEGVYGLQRALVAAGARSTLLSLWKVDDDATRAFMQAYYSRLLRGEGRAEALAHTQTAFRNHSNPLYRDLYVWAAFQLTGDWRPISQGR
jgi:CHAT domain-containing protein